MNLLRKLYLANQELSEIKDNIDRFSRNETLNLCSANDLVALENAAGAFNHLLSGIFSRDPYSADIDVLSKDANKYIRLRKQWGDVIRRMDIKIHDEIKKTIAMNFGCLREIDFKISSIANRKREKLAKEYSVGKHRVVALQSIVDSIVKGKTESILSAIDFSGDIVVGIIDSPGVYFLFSGNIELSYIGRSDNIEKRLRYSHHVYSDEHAVACVCIENRKECEEVEKSAILYARPPRNKQYLDNPKLIIDDMPNAPHYKSLDEYRELVNEIRDECHIADQVAS